MAQRQESQIEGGQGLIARGAVSSTAATAKQHGTPKEIPRVHVLICRTTRAKRQPVPGQLGHRANWGEGNPRPRSTSACFSRRRPTSEGDHHQQRCLPSNPFSSACGGHRSRFDHRDLLFGAIRPRRSRSPGGSAAAAESHGNCVGRRSSGNRASGAMTGAQRRPMRSSLRAATAQSAAD